MITLTEGAEKQVSKLLENRGKDSKGIRIGVTTKGCSGLSYSLEFVDDIQNSDEKVSFKDFTLFIDPKATFFLNRNTNRLRRGRITIWLSIF